MGLDSKLYPNTSHQHSVFVQSNKRCGTIKKWKWVTSSTPTNNIRHNEIDRNRCNNYFLKMNCINSFALSMKIDSIESLQEDRKLIFGPIPSRKYSQYPGLTPKPSTELPEKI